MRIAINGATDHGGRLLGFGDIHFIVNRNGIDVDRVCGFLIDNDSVAFRDSHRVPQVICPGHFVGDVWILKQIRRAGV